MYAKLIAEKTKYAILYESAFPKKDNAFDFWQQKISITQNDVINDSPVDLTHTEAIGIVNWVYRVLKNAKEREDFTLELFSQLKDFYRIRNNITYTQGIFYNKVKVDIHFISSISKLNDLISIIKNRGNQLFFRGHSESNFLLCPSIMRNKHLIENESKMYHDLLINCPNDFEKCHTHLEKLVEMQHYGLPTRLLDITRNLLVALYFACESNFETFGELILISAINQDIKYPQSDTISILASLPLFSYEKQIEFMNLAKDASITNEEFNRLAGRLLHEVRLEKPAFQAEINKDDILNSFIVYAIKNNNRIVKQDGAFILCGLSDTTNYLEKFRYKENNKKVIVLISNKKKILEQLESFSINRATLFPEIECVSDYIKNKYSH